MLKAGGAGAPRTLLLHGDRQVNQLRPNAPKRAAERAFHLRNRTVNRLPEIR